MKKFLAPVLLLALAACASIPQPARVAAPMVAAPKPFAVEQYELLMIEYTSPTTVDAIDSDGPADKIFSCGRAGAAGVAQAPAKGRLVYVPTCIPIVFKGPLTHGAVGIEPVAANVHVLFWTGFALDYDASGHYVKGEQPQGPYPSSAVCGAQSQADIKRVYANGKVAKTDSVIAYCVPIVAYGEQADGSQTVQFHVIPYSAPCPYYPFPGAGACEIATKL
jgi:hypothetical protein